ncbi:MAG: hypothetical protein ACI4DP_03310, partial [Candidatus Ornithomonoglobus sp.]
MKLKKMLNFCKAEKKILFYGDKRGNRYLSDRKMWALLNRDSTLDASSALEFLEVSEDAAEEYECDNTIFNIDLDSYSHNIQQNKLEELHPLPVSLYISERLVPFRTESGLLLMKDSRRQVFSDWGMKQYYLSEFEGATIVLVASGGILVGMIRPELMDYD